MHCHQWAHQELHATKTRSWNAPKISSPPVNIWMTVCPLLTMGVLEKITSVESASKIGIVICRLMVFAKIERGWCLHKLCYTFKSFTNEFSRNPNKERSDCIMVNLTGRGDAWRCGFQNVMDLHTTNANLGSITKNTLINMPQNIHLAKVIKS